MNVPASSVGASAKRTVLDSSEKWEHKWGFRDTEFVIHPDRSITLSGDRYPLCGIRMPYFIPFAEETFGLAIDPNDLQREVQVRDVPPAQRNAPFVQEITANLSDDQWSFDDQERLIHSHGQTSVDEVYRVLYDSIERVVDMVVYCNSESDVRLLVELAVRYDVCLIPYGGGTNVSSALRIPPSETRMVVSVDLSRLNRVLWIDRENLRACIQAGITGRSLEDELGKLGLTLGHEPDSIEFSTLGGWIATNASGMKKNRYGNIEDMVLNVTLVTPQGKIEETQTFGRISTGMRVGRLVFGMEGNLGIITSAVVRLCRKPSYQKYQSLGFPDLQHGVDFLRELRTEMSLPASVRLMDNRQFRFGQGLKPQMSRLQRSIHNVLRYYLLNVKKFDAEKFVGASVLMEGNKRELVQYERNLIRLARKFQGIPGGPQNGRRGYMLTFSIAYVRELFSKLYILGETFETTVPWTNVMTVYNAVIAHAHAKQAEYRLPGKPLICGRVTQLYPTDACVYFTYAVMMKGIERPAKIFAEIEHSFRDVILQAGGSLSHHHGIGKLRQSWIQQTVTPETVEVLQAIKRQVDPTNVFGVRNNMLH